jgi:hypothetical protein
MIRLPAVFSIEEQIFFSWQGQTFIVLSRRPTRPYSQSKVNNLLGLVGSWKWTLQPGSILSSCFKGRLSYNAPGMRCSWHSAYLCIFLRFLNLYFGTFVKKITKLLKNHWLLSWCAECRLKWPGEDSVVHWIRCRPTWKDARQLHALQAGGRETAIIVKPSTMSLLSTRCSASVKGKGHTSIGHLPGGTAGHIAVSPDKKYRIGID